MPSSSHASRSAGVGVLCAVRQPFPFMSFIFCTRYHWMCAGTATPTAAKSWWLAEPAILTGTPLRANPRSALKRAERTPKVTFTASTATPPTVSVVARR